MSRYNRLKVGDKVELKRDGEGLKWYVDHIASSFQVNNEIRSQDFPTIFLYLNNWIYNQPLYGKIVGYGSNDDCNNRELKKLFVKVEFKQRIKNRIYYNNMYVSERVLIKL